MTAGDPSPYVWPGGELSLTNAGQLELLRAVTERGLSLRTTVRGISMMPSIRDEDVVTIAPMDDRGPRVGEVVAFVLPGADKLMLHRVVARKPVGWLLRGDNCRESDGVVAGEKVLGRVVRVERNGRDVRFGTGLTGVAIACLSQSGGLAFLGTLRRARRRLASSALRRVQGLALFRAAGRRMASGVEIIEASENDVQAAGRRLKRSDDGALPEHFSNACIVNWLAKRNNRIVGLVQLLDFQDSDSPWVGHWLFSLTVRGRYRGLGIGEALVSRVIERAQAGGAARLSLAVFEDNTRAIRLFRKLAFTQTAMDGLEPELDAEKRLCGRRRIVMWKRLV